MLEAINISKL